MTVWLHGGPYAGQGLPALPAGAALAHRAPWVCFRAGAGDWAHYLRQHDRFQYGGMCREVHSGHGDSMDLIGWNLTETRLPARG